MKQYLNIGEIDDFEDFNNINPNIIMLADISHPANVVQDHINSFRIFFSSDITIVNPISDKTLSEYQLYKYDALIIHYSIYILGEYYLSSKWAELVKKYPGLKIQIIQDEHRAVNQMIDKIHELEISVILSSLDTSVSRLVYNNTKMAGKYIVGCLPGYIAERYMRIIAPPIKDRHFDVVYRGRTLKPYLGLHSKHKADIGELMLEISKRYSLISDINITEDARIYGDVWNDFITKSKTILGVEGGASIFDFDGSITQQVNKYLTMHPNASFEQVWQDANLYLHEGNIVHKTITPRIFEAIAAKTALILFPGEYRGLLKPGIHYIELRPDGSNAEEVVKKIKDNDYLQNMVDRAYFDITSKSELSFNFYCKKIKYLILKLNKKNVYIKNHFIAYKIRKYFSMIENKFVR